MDVAKNVGRRAFVGFSAATGGGSDEFDALSWQFTTGDPNEQASCSGSYVLSGPAGGALYVDDDLTVSVNGTQVYGDIGHGAANRNPISFNAAAGDTVQVSFFDTFGVDRGHSTVWLSGSGVALQQVDAAFSGGPGETYPAEAKQPYDIVVFQVPAAGQTVTMECLPSVTLDTSHWTISPDLQVHTATTKAYDVTWTVDSHDYNYTPDCNGWVGDVFISGANEWATVEWNTITNELRTSAVSGQAYSPTIARDCAQWAVNTTFPAGDMGLLTVQ